MPAAKKTRSNGKLPNEIGIITRLGKNRMHTICSGPNTRPHTSTILINEGLFTTIGSPPSVLYAKFKNAN